MMGLAYLDRDRRITTPSEEKGSQRLLRPFVLQSQHSLKVGKLATKSGPTWIDVGKLNSIHRA